MKTEIQSQPSISALQHDPRCCKACWSHGMALPVRESCPVCVRRDELIAQRRAEKKAALEKLLSTSGNLTLEQCDEVSRLMQIVKGGAK